MSYCELLAQGIEKSGLTFDEIEARTIEHGVRVSKSYLSYLRSGKQAPPSAEMSRVLEKVLDMPEGTLVWPGYMERAPKEVQEAFKNFKEENPMENQECINTLEKRIADLERQLQDRPMSLEEYMEAFKTQQKAQSTSDHIVEEIRRGFFGKEETDKPDSNPENPIRKRFEEQVKRAQASRRAFGFGGKYDVTASEKGSYENIPLQDDEVVVTEDLIRYFKERELRFKDVKRLIPVFMMCLDRMQEVRDV